jgi:hypothetical protein
MFRRKEVRCEGSHGSLPCWRTSTHGVRKHEDGRMLCEEHIQEAYVGRQIKVGDWMWERVLVCNPVDNFPGGVRWRKCTVVWIGESTMSIMYEKDGLTECKTIKRYVDFSLKFNLGVGDIPFENPERLFS